MIGIERARGNLIGYLRELELINARRIHNGLGRLPHFELHQLCLTELEHKTAEIERLNALVGQLRAQLLGAGDKDTKHTADKLCVDIEAIAEHQRMQAAWWRHVYSPDTEIIIFPPDAAQVHVEIAEWLTLVLNGQPLPDIVGSNAEQIKLNLQMANGDGEA